MLHCLLIHFLYSWCRIHVCLVIILVPGHLRYNTYTLHCTLYTIHCTLYISTQALGKICLLLFNRPGVAGAVLQPPPSLIDLVTHPLVKISYKHSQSQTGRAKELKFSENIHPTICVMCHVSHVTCHLSPVTCHL